MKNINIIMKFRVHHSVFRLVPCIVSKNSFLKNNLGIKKNYDTLSTGDKTSCEQKVFLKADASAVCNALAMCLQFSLLSCHCSVIF